LSLNREAFISHLFKQGVTSGPAHSLRWEITFALVIKIALIFALWYAFFREPVDKNLTDSQVGHALFGSLQSEQKKIPEKLLVPGLQGQTSHLARGDL